MSRKKKKKQYYQRRFLMVCAAIVMVLFVVRRCVPSVMHTVVSEVQQELADTTSVQSEAPLGEQQAADDAQPEVPPARDTAHQAQSPEQYPADSAPSPIPSLAKMDGKKHRIYSVPDYLACFPDSQHTQIAAAERWGVPPSQSREDMEHHKDRVVYVGSCPYYVVDPTMKMSTPYLVPRASHLLQRIGRNFLDSLAVKHIPLHRIIVSSVWRTKDDISNLSRGNANAISNSCHQYATTFDINYNIYSTVQPPHGPRRREVGSDTLKFVLSEVLRDLREEGACYVKYEQQQPCYHITVR